MIQGHVFILIICLILLIFLAAFFSASETGMMAINRYRLRHLLHKKNRAAKRVDELLARPDRLLGVVLISNNIVNIVASVLTTLIALRLFGDIGVAVATALLTFIIMVFADVMPKTLAALYPERIAFLCSWPLKIFLKLLYPIVIVTNFIANSILSLFGVKIKPSKADVLSHEELRSLVHGATGKGFSRYRQMLLRILDLENAHVEDIMVPRSDVIGIDIENDWDVILQQLAESQHTRLPVYKDNIDHVVGMLHLRRALNLMSINKLNKENMLLIAEPVHFIPESTPLNIQLLNFQREKSRSGLVVDEYGDIQGLVTLEDILEEIVGKFTTTFGDSVAEYVKQIDESYLIEGSMSIREINRVLHLELPTDGPKTLSGLIVEYLETLPISGVCLRIAGYPIEILAITENLVKTAQIWPAKRLLPDQVDGENSNV